MASTGIRELRAERLRTEVRARALALFEARGYEAVTMDEVASAGLVSLRTLYRLFGTKEGLLFEDHAPTVEAFRQSLAELGVQGACRRMAEAFECEAEAWRRRMRVIESEAALRGRTALLDEGFIEALVPHLGRGRRARLRAEALFGALSGAFRIWQREPGLRLPRLVDEALDLLGPLLPC